MMSEDSKRSSSLHVPSLDECAKSCRNCLDWQRLEDLNWLAHKLSRLLRTTLIYAVNSWTILCADVRFMVFSSSVVIRRCIAR